LSRGDIGVRAGRPNRLTAADRGRSSLRARHLPDFEWRLERESCIVNPVEEYAPNIVTSRRWWLARLAAGQDR